MSQILTQRQVMELVNAHFAAELSGLVRAKKLPKPDPRFSTGRYPRWTAQALREHGYEVPEKVTSALPAVDQIVGDDPHDILDAIQRERR